MAVKKDIKAIINGFKIGNHSFLNGVTDAVKTAVNNRVSDLELMPSGRQQKGNLISIKLIGEAYQDNPEETKKRVDDVIQRLKNANILVSLIK